MKTHLTEGKFIIYSVAAIVLLMMVHLFQSPISVLYNPENYVGIHILLECISICISAAVFIYGLKSYQQTRSSQMLLLAITFFLVGSIDLLHTLSFKGMPYFISESSVAKATWFWVIARVIQAVLMLLVLIIPERRLKRDYRLGALVLGILIVCSIGLIVFYFEKQLPLLMVEGKGTTMLKNAMEYGITFIEFICLLITLYQYHVEKGEEKLSVALAFVFLLLMELVFTIYKSVYDIDHFIGHIFKTLGFYYILKGYYFLNVHEAAERELPEQKNQQQGLNQIPDKPFRKNSEVS